jgi:hypothetical protein
VKKFIIAATVALVALPSAAHAKNWWMYSAGDHACTVPPDFFRTPLIAEQNIRSSSTMGTPITTAHRNDAGEVIFVTIETKTGVKNLELIWFASKALCQSFKTNMDNGAGSKDELN